MIHLLKRLVIYFLLSSLICSVLLFFGAKFYGEPFVENYIEEDIAKKFGLQIQIDKVVIRFLPPISIKLEGLNINSADGAQNLQADAAEVFLDIFKMLPHFPTPGLVGRATLTKPVMMVKLPFLPPQTFIPPAGSLTPPGGVDVELPGAFILNLSVDVQDGQVQVLQQQSNKGYVELLRLEKMFTTLKVPDLNGEWEFTLFANVGLSKLSTVSIPVEVKSSLGLDLKPLRLKVTSAELRVGGIPAALSGWFDPATLFYSWNIKMDVPDLGKIRSFVLPGTWSGVVQADVKVDKIPALQMTGQLEIKNVYGDIEVMNQGLKLSGSVGVNASSQFSFANGLKINSLNLSTNLTNMAMGYEKLFHKDRGVPMSFVGNLSHEGNSFSLNQLNFELAQLKGTFAGKVSLGESSDFKLLIPQTNLTGLEKYFPLFKSPLVGTAEANIEIKGEISKPATLFLDINPLILNNVRMDTSWKSEDKTKSIDGVVSIDTRSNLRIQNQELKSSVIDAQIDLTRVGINWGDLFVKPAANLFKLELRANQKDFWANIEKAQFATTAGIIYATGNIRDPIKPQMEIKVQTPQVDLTRLSALLPMLKKWNLIGTVSGEVALNGRYDPLLGIEKAPLRMNGFFKAQVPEFSYTPETPKDGKVVASPPTGTNAPAPQPLIPPWPILTDSILKTDVSIGKLKFKDLLIEGIDWKGNFARGVLAGQMGIKKFFKGSVTIPRVRLSLKEAAPTTQVEVLWSEVDSGKAFDWFLPNWKGMFQGVSGGTMNMTLLHPSNPKLLRESLASGKVNLRNAFFSTFKLDEMVNAKLSQIPGLGSKAKVSTKGVSGTLNVDFEYVQELLRFSKLEFSTPEKNALSAVGWIKTDKSLSIKGNAYIVNPPVQGSVRAANSDGQGRLVVPVEFEGFLMEPKLNIAEAAIKGMLTKTAEYEGRRLKGEAKKALDGEVNKAKKKVQDELTKGIKGLIGQ